MREWDRLAHRCEGGALLEPAEARAVLDPALPPAVLARVLAAADRRMRAVCANRGRLYATIGVDAAPCAMNCRFCSHGAAWGLGGETFELTAAEVCDRARRLCAQAPDWLTLRTTQHYGVARLAALARRVRAVLPARTALLVNTGEFAPGDAQTLAEAGVSMAYHTYRLREGIDTGVAPAERLRTLALVRDSPLRLAALVEPVGAEHTADELVEAAFRLRTFGVALGGAMARVPVPGTPLAAQGAAAEDRMVRTIAVTRLISGPELQNICIHPPLAAALRAGANTVVVESGAVPRAAAREDGCWRDFGVNDAVSLLTDAGYAVGARGAVSGNETGKEAQS